MKLTADINPLSYDKQKFEVKLQNAFEDNSIMETPVLSMCAAIAI